MSIGEKIQYYRKKAGLSQEELGQKLFVSRQTVSQWEQDKTVPTVDNLVLLKKVLGVSTDDLLDDIEIEDGEQKPLEQYDFTYSKTEINMIYNCLYRGHFIRTVLFSALCIFYAVIPAAEPKNSALVFFSAAVALVGVLTLIRLFIISDKTKKALLKQFDDKTFIYEVFDGYFTLRINKNNDEVKKLKISFDGVERRLDSENFILFVCGQELLVVKKNEIKEYSALNSVTAPHPKALYAKKRFLSVLLCILSSVSIIAAFIVFTIVAVFLQTEEFNGFKYAWIFFTFLPVPISSILYSVYLKKQGYVYRRNLIIGIIMSLVLLMCGIPCFFF